MSSDDIAISVRNLTKTYRLFGHPGDRVKQFFSFGLKQYHREFTALSDVSFDIKKGEVVGIIGRNGSGKSTLLQLICGILKPTAGSVTVNGRVSALLELGAGFNPEFTGRENVFFQGALMGFTRAQMEARFDEIAEFADIGEFIDQPVRTYSSGMYVRLAFAVAVSVAPEILVVDEALAVGDHGFQRKCFARIDALRNAGCTVLFVSHDLGAILSQSDRAMLLRQGRLVNLGEPKRVTEDYLDAAGTRVDGHAASAVASANYDPALVPHSTLVSAKAGAEILAPVILDMAGQPVNLLVCGQEYAFAFDARFEQACEQVRFGMMIKSLDGRQLGGLSSARKGEGATFAAGMQFRQQFRFRCTLLAGTYFINAAVVGSDGEYLHRVIDAAMFSVLPDKAAMATGFVDFSPGS